MTVFLGVLLGPAVLLSVVAAPIVGWLLHSWLVGLALVGGAALTAALGWLIAALTRAVMTTQDVSVQFTTSRAIARRGTRVEELRWHDVVAVAAQRGSGVDAVGEVMWLDVAALVVGLTLNAAAERSAPTTSAFWHDATGLILRGQDGRVLTLPTRSAASVGLEVVRALAEKRPPSWP